MDTNKRCAALDYLMKEIYENLNVNFEDRKVIINDDRIRKTLYSPISVNNVRRLFEVTFKDADVEFEDKKHGKSFELNETRVTNNIINYFIKLGVSIPVIKNLTERRLLGKRMCNAIIKHILPAIFNNINTKRTRIDIEEDDISFEFNKAVERIKTEFNTEDFSEQLYLDINESEIEKLYDSDFTKNECTHALLVSTAYYRPFEKYKFIPSIYYYCTDNDKELPPEPIEHDCLTFEELTLKLEQPKDLDLKNFVSPYYYNSNTVKSKASNNDLQSKYKIDFNIECPNPSFIPKYFYFMTKLNEDITNKDFCDCKSPEMLNDVLSEKAIRQIRKKYKKEIEEYYNNTLESIEEIFKKFFAIDIETIINQKITSVDDFKKALHDLCNINDIDAVWQFCTEKKLPAHKSSRYIYCGIEKAMHDFALKISDSLMQEVSINSDQVKNPHLLRAMERSLSKDTITDHADDLKRLLKIANIDNLCKLRDKFSSYTWNSQTGNNLTYNNDSDIWPEYGKNDTSDNIYHCIKRIINVYCDELERFASPVDS